MAVTMKINPQEFVESLYKDHPTVNVVNTRLQALLAQGWTITFGVFMVTLTKGKDTVAENLPAPTSSVVPGKISPAQIMLCRAMFEGLLADAEAAEGAGQIAPDTPFVPVKQAAPKLTPMADAPEAQKLKASLEKDGLVNVNPNHIPTKPSPLSEAVKAAPKVSAAAKNACALKDAAALGQLVYGTSKDSLYRTIAIGKGKIAAKVASNGVSLRVEGEISPACRKELTDMGFSDKGIYLSMHAVTNVQLPASRIIGAVLMSLPAGEFNEQISTAKGLK